MLRIFLIIISLLLCNISYAQSTLRNCIIRNAIIGNWIITFGVASDIHYDKDNASGASSTNLAKLLTATQTWNSQNCDFVICLGDTVDSNIDAANELINLANIDNVLDVSNSPAYLIIGNHDTEKLNVDSLVAASPHIPSRYYTFTIKGVKFICLRGANLSSVSTKINDSDGITSSDDTITVDSTTSFTDPKKFVIESEAITYTSKDATHFYGCSRGMWGTTAVVHNDNVTISDNFFKMDQTQIDWLETELATPEPKIVFIHQRIDQNYPGNPPNFTTFPKWSDFLDNAEQVRAKIEAGVNVISVLCGHGHENMRTVVNGITYIEFKNMSSNPTAFATFNLYPNLRTYTVTGYGNQSSY